MPSRWTDEVEALRVRGLPSAVRVGRKGPGPLPPGGQPAAGAAGTTARISLAGHKNQNEGGGSRFTRPGGLEHFVDMTQPALAQFP